MNHSKRRYWYLFPAWGVLALIASGCTAYTPVRQHPDLAQVRDRIVTIAVIEPEVEYVQVVFTGDNARQPERERAIANELTTRLRSGVENKGYTVRAETNEWLDKPNVIESSDLQAVRAAYRQAAAQLYERAATDDEARQYRVSIGPGANPVAVEKRADALLIVRYAGYEKSGGERAKDVVVGSLLGVRYASRGGTLEVALIDGTTGDVLWANRGFVSDLGGGRRGYGRMNATPTAAVSAVLAEFPISARQPAASTTPR
jgi:hypothetical protein